MCSKARDVLIRCQIDETQKWHFVCPGVCWKSVSGVIEDAKGVQDEYPHYRYGGMVSFLEERRGESVADARCGQWKDRSADGPISAKKPKKVKERQREEMKMRTDKRREGAGESHDRVHGVMDD